MKRLFKKKPSDEVIEEPEAEKPRRKERKVVPEEEVENCVNHGWNPIMALPSGEVLIEREIE